MATGKIDRETKNFGVPFYIQEQVFHTIMKNLQTLCKMSPTNCSNSEVYSVLAGTPACILPMEYFPSALTKRYSHQFLIINVSAYFFTRLEKINRHLFPLKTSIPRTCIRVGYLIVKKPSTSKYAWATIDSFECLQQQQLRTQFHSRHQNMFWSPHKY